MLFTVNFTLCRPMDTCASSGIGITLNDRSKSLETVTGPPVYCAMEPSRSIGPFSDQDGDLAEPVQRKYIITR